MHQHRSSSVTLHSFKSKHDSCCCREVYSSLDDVVDGTICSYFVGQAGNCAHIWLY
jgi:hypothetical protein